MKRPMNWSTLALTAMGAFTIGSLWAQANTPTVTVTCTRGSGQVCTRWVEMSGMGGTTRKCAEYGAAASYGCDLSSTAAITAPRKVAIQ